jgi:hypothetical protein
VAADALGSLRAGGLSSARAGEAHRADVRDLAVALGGPARERAAVDELLAAAEDARHALGTRGAGAPAASARRSEHARLAPVVRVAAAQTGQGAATLRGLSAAGEQGQAGHAERSPPTAPEAGPQGLPAYPRPPLDI